MPDPRPGSDPDDRPYPDLPVVSAESARAFGDSVGVGAALNWDDTAYGNFELVRSRLLELGVRHVRDGLCSECRDHIPRLNRLAADGIKAHIISGELREGSPGLVRNLTAIRDRLQGSVVSVEPPNEPDMTGDPDWLAKTRAWQRELWTRVKGDPQLAHLLVLGPAVSGHPARASVGDLSDFLDRGNMHPYPGGQPPYNYLQDELRREAPITGGKPVQATEIGYHTDLTSTSQHRPASERAAAHYMPRIPLEGFKEGVERSFIYTLADLWSPDEAARRGFSKLENSFGLLRWDLSPKPSFLALRNLLDATNSDSAPVPNPGGLRYDLEGEPSDIRQLLLRSSDGGFALVLWRTVSVWDREQFRDLHPQADSLEVVLGQPTALAKRFDPVSSSEEQARWTYPRRIPIALGGAPVVLRFAGAGAGSTSAARSASQAGTGATSKSGVRLRIVAGSAARRTKKAPLKPTTKAPLKPFRLKVRGARARLGRSATVAIRCRPPCRSVGATGRLVVRAGARKRRYRPRPTRAVVRKGRATLRLKISARAHRVAVKALRRRGKVKLVVTLSPRSAGGAKLGTLTRTLTVKRGNK